MESLGKPVREWREDWGNFPGSIPMRISVSISAAPTSEKGDSDYSEKKKARSKIGYPWDFSIYRLDTNMT